MVILLIQKFYTCIYLNSQLAISNISKDAQNTFHLQCWCVNLRQRSPTLTVCLQYALAEQVNNSIVGMCYEYMYCRPIRVWLEHSCPTLPILPIIFTGLIGERQNCRCEFCRCTYGKFIKYSATLFLLVHPPTLPFIETIEDASKSWFHETIFLFIQ